MDDCTRLVRTLQGLGATVILDDVYEDSRTVVIGLPTKASIKFYELSGSGSILTVHRDIAQSFLTMGYRRMPDRPKKMMVFRKPNGQEFHIGTSATPYGTQSLIVGYSE